MQQIIAFRAPRHVHVDALREHEHGLPADFRFLYPPDAPLIRAGTSAQQDPVVEAIARHVTESGSVFLELPDGRLTVVLHLDGKAWIARRCDDGGRG